MRKPRFYSEQVGEGLLVLLGEKNLNTYCILKWNNKILDRGNLLEAVTDNQPEDFHWY